MQENKKNTLKNTPKEDPPEPCYLCEMDMNEHGHWYIDSEDESVCTPCHDKHFTTCHYFYFAMSLFLFCYVIIFIDRICYHLILKSR